MTRSNPVVRKAAHTIDAAQRKALQSDIIVASSLHLPAMIKLQLLLRRPRSEPKLDAPLRARIEQHGINVTGSGRASISAAMTEDAFAHLFGAHGSLQSGYASLSEPPLPVPPALQEEISLITLVPRHGPTDQPSRVHHASV